MGGKGKKGSWETSFLHEAKLWEGGRVSITKGRGYTEAHSSSKNTGSRDWGGKTWISTSHSWEPHGKHISHSILRM